MRRFGGLNCHLRDCRHGGPSFRAAAHCPVPFMAWMFPGDDILSRIGLTKSGDEKSFARACETLQIPQDADKSRVMRAYIHLGQEATSVTNATCAESWAKQQLAHDTVSNAISRNVDSGNSPHSTVVLDHAVHGAVPIKLCFILQRVDSSGALNGALNHSSVSPE